MITGKYIGQTNCSERHGFGVYTYGHGFFQYAGQWLHNEKHGKGRLIMSDGSYYEGTFDHNEITGQGRQYYAWSNNLYEGDFSHGERHGQGKMMYGNGDIYNGTWVNNRMEGEGELDYADGSRYAGSFLENKRNGYGILQTALFIYDGFWNMDTFEGEGTLRMTSGAVYQGEFFAGKPHGQGTLFRPHPQAPTYSGLWDQGLPVQAPVSLKLFSDTTSSVLSSIASGRSALSTIGSTSDAIPSPFTKVEYEISPTDLKNGFDLFVCVYTETEKLLTEESNRQLMLWIGRRISEPFDEKPIIYTNCKQSAIIESLKQSEKQSIPTPFGFDVVPICEAEPDRQSSISTECNQPIGTPEDHRRVTKTLPSENMQQDEANSLREPVAEEVDESLKFAELPSCQRVRTFVEKTGRGCAKWTKLIPVDESNSNRSDKISSESMNETERILPQLDEFIVIVEDITPYPSSTSFPTDDCCISPEIVEPPPRLPSLYIKLAMSETSS